jgi:hypothetical protein
MRGIREFFGIGNWNLFGVCDLVIGIYLSGEIRAVE